MNAKEWDKHFKRLGPETGYEPARFKAIAELCKGKVFDVGCASGILADFYKGNYLGIDLSKVATDFARDKNRPDAIFLCGDYRELAPEKFTDFDTVVFAEFLEHFRNPHEVFDKILPHIKEGTRFIFSVPNGDRIPDPDHKFIFTVPQMREYFSRYGTLHFKNFLGFDARILAWFDYKVFTKPILTMACPVKDEGVGLENTILSCIDFVDAVVISVDSKTTDNSKAVAERYADKVLEHVWADDFSAVRNFLQKNVETDWTLVMDGHELADFTEDIRSKFDPALDGYFVKMFWEGGFNFYFPRLVRTNILWSGRVHNHPDCKKIKRMEGFKIKHARVGGQAKSSIAERDRQRSRMVKGIMAEEAKKNKRNTRAWFYLGLQNYTEGHYKLAIKAWKKYIKYSTFKSELWFVYFHKSLAHVALGQFLRAKWALRDAEKTVPGRWETKKQLAFLYMLLHKWDLAILCFTQSLIPPKVEHIFQPVLNDLPETWDFLGQCYQNLGMTATARIAWSRALKLEKEVQNREQFKPRIEALEKIFESKKT